MKTCPSCRFENPIEARFCTQCRARLVPLAKAQIKDDDPFIDEVVDSRFRVIERIGKGGMATVYRAEQTSIRRQVALKILSPKLNSDIKLKERFRNEAALASRLNHPNTVTVHDFGITQEGVLYIAMELIDGVSLTDEMTRRKTVPWKRACRIAAQISSSLQDAHENSIIHRDLKPDNIMLAEDEIGAEFVKVLDFGIAKIITEDGSLTWDDLTSPNEVFGTPEYMSPEQVSGEKLDHRTDIYSLGVIFYRMLTGCLPFEAETPMIMMSNHLREPPRPFFLVNAKLWLPPRLEELVMAMLAKDPDDRPESMRAVVEEIVEILKSGSKGFAGWTPSCGISVDRHITRTPYPAHSPYEAAFQAGFEAGYKANSSTSESSPTLPDLNMDSEPIVSDSGLFAAIEGREPTGGHQF